MSRKINVIDLFAGPGGLGEGFSAFSPDDQEGTPFRIRMSVEKEVSAHRTLTVRAMYRRLKRGGRQNLYHRYLKGELTLEELKGLAADDWNNASEETLGQPTALGEDNRKVHDRLNKLKMAHPEGPWIVIGGPPCQAYSLVGRSRNKGVKGYKAEDDDRHFLYREYLEVLSIIKPDVFVMENVKGILTSKVKGERVFPKIKSDLEDPAIAVSGSMRNRRRYHIYSFVKKPDDIVGGKPVYTDDSQFVIRAEDYGVPQARHRVILLGVAEDLAGEPDILRSRKPVPIEAVIPGLPSLRSKLSKLADEGSLWMESIASISTLAIKDLESAGCQELAEEMRVGLQKLKWKAPTRSSKYGKSELRRDMVGDLKDWLLNDTSGQVLNHESRGHIAGDLARYYFCASWAKIHGGSLASIPKASDFPKALEPNHANWKSGHFADRFRVQKKGRPATTITSHISKDGHYYIHYDPAQCRSLTVREAARIQTFPDNYHFEGNRTQQYVQVGNAVPPYLAYQLAAVVFKLLRNN